MTSQFKKSGKFIIMNDGAFAIRPEEYAEFESFDHRDSIGLYIRDGMEIDDDTPLKRLITRKFIVCDEKTYTINRAKYKRYTFYRPLVDKRVYRDRRPIEDSRFRNENDCLKFAESISVANDTLRKQMFDRLVRSETSPCVYKAKDTSLLFGMSDTKNRNLLSKIHTKNNETFPSPCEAYAIVRREIVAGSAPYHIAYVLYKNNGVNITLEANADAGAEYIPRFGFYDMKHTFHKVMAGSYTNGTTIVLQPRPINDFLTEFANE